MHFNTKLLLLAMLNISFFALKAIEDANAAAVYCKTTPETNCRALLCKKNEYNTVISSLVANDVGSIVYEQDVTMRKKIFRNILLLHYMDDITLDVTDSSKEMIKVLVEESYNNLDEEDHNTFSLIVIDIASEKVFNNYLLNETFNEKENNEKPVVISTNSEKLTIEALRAVGQKRKGSFLEPINYSIFNRFQKVFARFRRWAQKNLPDTDEICIVGSGVLGCYGWRDSNDLDFIYNKNVEFAHPGQSYFHDNLVEENHHYPYSYEEIINNEDYHFYYKGIKFCTLDVLKAMKENRNELVDQADVILINNNGEGNYASFQEPTDFFDGLD